MKAADLQRMSRAMRHRLRNIAAGIHGAVTLIDDEAGETMPSELREYFPLILRECDALSDIAQRLSLMFAADLEGGDPIDVMDVSETVVSASSERFPGVTLLPESTADSVPVTRLMVTALSELVVNACEATPNGMVRLCAGQMEDGRVRWIVSDSGSGVNDSDRDKLFEPFFTSRPRHLGVGLNIARRLSRLAGGACEPLPPRRSPREWAVELSCQPCINRQGGA